MLAILITLGLFLLVYEYLHRALLCEKESVIIQRLFYKDKGTLCHEMKVIFIARGDTNVAE